MKFKSRNLVAHAFFAFCALATPAAANPSADQTANLFLNSLILKCGSSFFLPYYWESSGLPRWVNNGKIDLVTEYKTSGASFRSKNIPINRADALNGIEWRRYVSIYSTMERSNNVAIDWQETTRSFQVGALIIERRGKVLVNINQNRYVDSFSDSSPVLREWTGDNGVSISDVASSKPTCDAVRSSFQGW